MQDWQGEGRIEASERRYTRMRLAAGAAAMLAFCGVLQACASDPEWPTLGKVTDVDAMTPEQRSKAVQDLQKDNPGQNAGTPAKPSQ